MGDNVQFYVDDSSPSISYFPFGDTFSVPNLTAGWNPYFDGSGFASALGETGDGASYHVTSLDGASISVQWKGTGIQFFGQVKQATYTITLDGMPAQYLTADLSNDILADFTNLTDGSHTVVLTTRIPDVQDQPEFFFDKVLITGSRDTTPNVSVTQRALNDSDIAYSGQWSFGNAPGNSFHHSAAVGDRAEVQFQGISFLLNGTTSPTSGRYTVILDNVATTLSAKSSFTKQDSLLFYACSLDPNVTHTVQVINEDGGDLSLDVGGFAVFSAESTTSSETPSPTPSPPASLDTSSSHRKGTIAALALAGVLAFIVLTGLLFFFFVVRPRRRRHRHLVLEQCKKEPEPGIVINIGPEAGPDVELIKAETSPLQRSSEKSGFARWKREVEGGLGSLIGISFRHSNSSRGKGPSRHPADNERSSPKSSLFSSSSKLSPKRNKGKGPRKPKGQHTDQSVALELPVRSSSMESGKDKYISPSQDLPAGPNSVVSTLTSLSYVSSPSVHLHTRPGPPPSYSVSNSNRNSHSTGLHSVPHSVSHSLLSTNQNAGRESQGLPRPHSGSVPGSPDNVLPRDHYDSIVLPTRIPDAHSYVSPTPSEGWDGAQNSRDDDTSFLQAAITQFALRGLSPRTSEFDQSKAGESKPFAEEQLNIEPRVGPRPLPERPELRVEQSDNRGSHEALDISTDIPPALLDEGHRETEPQPFDDSFLNVIPSSPFRVDFPSARSLKQNRGSGPPISFVRFDEESKEDLIITGGEQDSSKQGAEQSQDSKGKRRSMFRLTPPSGPSNTPSSRRPRADSTSFLDFSSSSDSSTRTQSLVASDELEGSRQWANLPPHQRLQSRWSTSPTELSRNTSLGAPRSVFSGNFPYPVSLPTSPHHVRPVGITISIQQTPQHIHDASDDPTTGIHPLLPTSPADSVPMSVSEIQFRRTSATSHGTGSPLPPHPPLPGRETATESEDAITPLSTPNLIVQRVLGQTPTVSPTLPSYNPTT